MKRKRRNIIMESILCIGIVIGLALLKDTIKSILCFLIIVSFLFHFMIFLPNLQEPSPMAHFHFLLFCFSTIINLWIQKKNTILDSTLWVGVGIFIVLSLIFFLRIAKKIKQHLYHFILIPFLTIALYSSVIVMNTTLDRSEPTVSEAIVSSKNYYSSYKSSTSYAVYLLEENKENEIHKYYISSELYQTLNPNDHVFILRYRGLFHLAWISVQSKH